MWSVESMDRYYSKLHYQWKVKTPKQKWLTIYSIPAKMGKALGIRVLTDLKVDWFSYFSVVVLMFHYTALCHTFWFYFDRGEPLMSLQCLCSVGIFVSIIAAYVKAIGPDRAKLKNVVNFGNRHIYVDSNEPSKYHTLCEKMIKELIKDITVVVSAIAISYTTFGAGTFYAMIFQEKRVTLFGTILPFTDLDSDFGYAINMMQQSFVGIYGIVANFSLEIGGCLAYNAIEAVPQVFQIESDELANDVRSNGMTYGTTLRVRNILMQVQDLNMAVYEAVDVTYTRYMLGPFLCVLSVSFSIFSQMILGFPSGYGCAMCNYILVLIFCYLGENLKQSNERIALELYSMPWYLLSPSCQRGVITGIHWMQNGPAFKIGPFADLSFETASDLTKAVYRFTMLLFKMFK